MSLNPKHFKKLLGPHDPLSGLRHGGLPRMIQCPMAYMDPKKKIWWACFGVISLSISEDRAGIGIGCQANAQGVRYRCCRSCCRWCWCGGSGGAGAGGCGGGCAVAAAAPAAACGAGFFGCCC